MRDRSRAESYPFLGFAKYLGRESMSLRHTRPATRPAVIAVLSVALATVVGVGFTADARSHTGGKESSAATPHLIVVRPGTTTQVHSTVGTPTFWGLRESAAPAPPPTFPLRVSENGRYLVDKRGKPWRVQADAAWLMSSEATASEVDAYLAKRRAQGFNSFYLMAMVHPGGYSAAAHAPSNRRGDPPFATPGDFSSAGTNPASRRYWSWIDSIIAKAAAHHMVVMLAYTYLGYEGGEQGWYRSVLDQPNRAVLYNWGVWLGNHFKSAKNLIWLGLGDYAPPDGSEGALRARTIADGIKSTGASQLFMAEASSPDSIPGTVQDFGAVVDQNSFYGYGPGGMGWVYITADRAWKLSPTKPAWMQEGTYEYENNQGHFSAEPWDTRRGRFWSVLAGGTAGDGFGSKDVWQWRNIPRSLSSPGAEYSTVAFGLFGSLPWWELRPSGTGPGQAGTDLVHSGQGAWGGPSYITSALTSDRHWMLAYVPVMKKGPRTFSVAMSALKRPVRATWFDPTTGNYIAISDGYRVAAMGTRSFTTPGKRGDGTDDWLLVLDSTPVSPCGSITAGGVYTAPKKRPRGVTCEVTTSPKSDPSAVVGMQVRFEKR